MNYRTIILNSEQLFMILQRVYLFVTCKVASHKGQQILKFYNSIKPIQIFMRNVILNMV